MASSVIASIRFRSLLIIASLFTLVGLPHGEDTNDVIAHGKGDHHNTPEERAIQNKVWFPVLPARILGDKRSSVNTQWTSSKSRAQGQLS
jgi:hypothetical protein